MQLQNDSRSFAWLAGFVEGEGWIGAYEDKTRPYYGLRVKIAQKDRALLLKIKQLLTGIGLKVHIEKRLGKDGVYQMSLSCRQAEKFMQIIHPYLVGTKKSDQIRKALKLANKSEGVRCGRIQKYSLVPA